MGADTYIGWDLGGAHLKMAAIDRHGGINYVQQLATPVWQRDLLCLSDAISEICNQTPCQARHAMTTTAELVDIFTDRCTGIKELIQCLDGHFSEQDYRLYAGRHGLINTAQANTHLSDIASANWHATASFAAQHIPQGVLIDIGSTTTDIIPFAAGRLLNRAYNDHHRLRNDELIYTGSVRTPVMAVVQQIFYAAQWQNIAAENFATMADVYRLTGDLDERHDLMPTADGAEKTQRSSARRLARMLGKDIHDTDNISPLIEIAGRIADAQLEKIDQALSGVLSRSEAKHIDCLVGTGSGNFLSHRLAAKRRLKYIDFTDILYYPGLEQHKVQNCTAAISVAQIARTVDWHSC